MPPRYTQATRPLRVSTALEPDVLLLESFAGEEGMSRPFHYTLDLLSEDPDISATDLLRTPAAVAITLPGGGERTIHGVVTRFMQLGQREGLASYRAEVRPRLSLLALSRDCRVFQHKTVLEVVEEVLAGQPLLRHEVRCTGAYPKREYCVQYRETNLDFVSRLLEEEGIFYFFEHSANDHLLVLADSVSKVVDCPDQATADMSAETGGWLEQDVIVSFQREHAVHTGRVTLKDYDYLQPQLDLVGEAPGSNEELYDYPGRFAVLDESIRPTEVRDQGNRYARIRLEECESMQEVVHGESTCRAFRSGYRFGLQRHFRQDANQSYQLLRVQHTGRAGDVRSWTTAPFEYRNTFIAIPSTVPFRPARTAPKPIVHGSQTAVVVGPPGEEIKVDAHGRVKIQFHWDRLGEHNENSSCWVRVSTAWAGRGWGQLSIPRIGQEVIVDFLEGDPDQPIITGKVYNAEQTPPCDPGGRGGVVSGLRSKTHKGAGFNAMTMDDTAGNELVTIHAQYNMSTTVLNNDTQAVTKDRMITVDGTHTETIKGDTKITVQDGVYEHRVSAKTAYYQVKGLVTEEFLDAQHTTATNEVTITGNKGVGILGNTNGVAVIGNGKGVSIEGNAEGVLIKGAPFFQAEGTADVTILAPIINVGNATGEVTVSGTKITLTAGSGSIVIDAAGVTITGAIVKIN